MIVTTCRVAKVVGTTCSEVIRRVESGEVAIFVAVTVTLDVRVVSREIVDSIVLGTGCRIVVVTKKICVAD